MKKIFMLFIVLALSFTSFNCGGGAGGSNSPGGEKSSVPAIVQVLPSHYIAQTNSAIVIRAKILNGNGSPIRNVSVTFTNISPIGTLLDNKDVPIGSKTVIKTNDSGLATLKVKSTTTGFVTIQAEVNKGVGIVRDRKTLFFTSSLSLSPFMYLDADGNNNGIYNEPDDYTLFQNNNPNDNQVSFRATVFNKFGQRASGSTVTFGADFPYKIGSSTTCSDGSSSCSVTFPNGNTATTNSNGEAFVLVQVDPTLHNITTILNITAVADNGASRLYSLFLEPITISLVTVTANPTVVAPDATSTISAAVSLNTGGPPPDGTAVGFVAECGTVTPFALTTTGLATAKFTAPSVVPSPNPKCRVTATVDGVSGSADVTISSALTVQPATQSINGVAGGTVSYIISGGVAPYTVTSINRFAACNDGNTDGDCSDPEDSGIWNVTIPDAGGSFIFTVTVPAGTAAQSITLTVGDSTGQSKAATLTIGGAGALSVQPGTVSISGDAGGIVTFTIFGGVPPYDVFPNIADPAFTPAPPHVTASGGTFIVTVPLSTAAQTIIYTVRDSAATTTTGTLTITAPTPVALSMTPAAVTVTGTADATDNVTFTITNGTSPFTVISSNTAVVSVDSISSTGFTVDPKVVAASTTVTLTAIDHLGASQTATVTVTPVSSSMVLNPNAIAVTAGTPISIHIIGGLAPYTVYSSNVAVATVNGGGGPFTPPGTTFNVATLTAGTSQIEVVDSDGKTATTTVTVVGTVPDFTISCTPLANISVGLTGNTGNSICTVTSLNGFNSAVNLSCAGMPAAASSTCAFVPASIVPPPGLAASSSLTVNVAAGATLGSYSFNVVGTSVPLSHVIPMSLTIVP